ncbi:MAG: hypothetical protein COA80_10075 [Leeuwenhoekiella sp.]|nr:MAG: hypothetical protein COA80_10075 [Leeuwenhoekiella sp.]
MNIEAKKLELMNLLLQTQEERVLAKLKKVFEEEETDWWSEISEEEREEIETGLNQADAGDLIPYAEVKKHFDKWH